MLSHRRKAKTETKRSSPAAWVPGWRSVYWGSWEAVYWVPGKQSIGFWRARGGSLLGSGEAVSLLGFGEAVSLLGSVGGELSIYWVPRRLSIYWVPGRRSVGQSIGFGLGGGVLSIYWVPGRRPVYLEEEEEVE